MRLHTMTKAVFFYYILFLSFSITSLYSQAIPSDINSLNDDQIREYWGEAQRQGYTLEQVKSLAALRGVSDLEILQFEERINNLNQTGIAVITADNTALNINDGKPVGYTDNVGTVKVEDNPIFGMDFFNNPNISFTPNLNVATPNSYQLGPGDEVVINLWGAAENTYNLQINKEGVLRLPNIGPVFVSGLQIDEAREIVKYKLKRVYAGINAPDTSPYKVFVNISLSAVRSIQVDLIGEVSVPGTYTLNSLSSILNALYAAGGPTENGTFRAIKLVRQGSEPVYFDLYDYLVKGSQDGNVTLRDNDLIIVSPYLSRVTINGAIKRPGQFELKTNENFSDLLRFVSGFKAQAFKDNFSLKRIVGDRLALKEISYNNILNETLQSGDIIEVASIIDQVENSVSIEGPVYRPGKFEFSEGLTLKELIKKASGIRDIAYLDRGLIYRGNNYSTRESIPFSLKEVLDGSVSILLQNNDKVNLFTQNFLNFKGELTISGGVREPGSFPFYENLTIEDLILTAGGLSQKANPLIINVYRRLLDDNSDTLSKSFDISLGENGLDFSNTSKFILKPGDKVSIRLLKGINQTIDVFVEGEVNYPGNYSISNRGERISDAIDKAGGLSNYAFINGATLVRLNPFYKEIKEGVIVEELNNVANTKLNLKNKKEFRVGIDLKEILKNPEKAKQNLELKKGDRIIIPSIKSTVKTEGEILVPSLIREQDNMSFRAYINKSGGFSSDALRRKSYIIYPNGDIVATKKVLFFNKFPDVLPGSIIVVPKKIKKPNPITTQEVLGLSSGFATLALLVDRFFGN